MRRALSAGVRPPGGIVSYPLDRIYQEVAYIAYHFHWSPEDVLTMEHRERQVLEGKVRTGRLGRLQPAARAGFMGGVKLDHGKASRFRTKRK